jgi:hypothetical protein
MGRGSKKIPADPANNCYCQELIENRADPFIVEKVKLLFWFDVLGLLVTSTDRHDISSDFCYSAFDWRQTNLTIGLAPADYTNG